MPASQAIETTGAILQEYADRAVFRGFSGPVAHRGKAAFKILWHRDRQFELILDPAKKTLRFAVVLPGVPARSAMYREFKKFLESRFTKEVPDHRRIDRKKARVTCGNRGGNVSVTLTVLGGDYAYGTRKLIHLIHEVFLTFLTEYFEYQVEAFDLDPDHP